MTHSTTIKTFKYRLYPSKSQEKNLLRVLNCARGLYNMVLAERKYTYQLEGESIGIKETDELARHYRKVFPYAQQMFSQTAQVVVRQVDKVYQDFFRRLKEGKKGKKAGYPRFKGRNRFSSFEFPQYGTGAKLDGRRLKLFGIGRVPVRWHRPIAGEAKTVRIIHQAGKWYASFTCEVPVSEPLPEAKREIGLDMGLSALLTTSEGQKIENPKWYRAVQLDLKHKQRKLSRARSGSKNRKKKLLAVQRQHEKIANQRRDYLNKLAYGLVENFDLIAMEDLAIANMTQNHKLSKSILDAGWGYFRRHLTHKAESAGRVVVCVNPAYTSKCCSNCGHVFEEMTLATRWVDCPACGLSLDRDHNAALAVLDRARLVKPVKPNVAPLPRPNRWRKRKRA